MSVHQTPSGRWGVRWRDGDRNRQRIFTRKDDAENFDRDRQRARQMGAFARVEPSGMTITELLSEWWAAESPGWSRSNIVPRANILDNWVVPYLAGVALRELGPARITQFRQEITGAGCTPKQANRVVAILSAALGWAVRMDYLPENPVSKLKRLTINDPTPRPRAINVERVEQLRQAMPTARDQAMVSVLFYAGLRPGELLALRWSDIGERTITVDRSYAMGELKGTKTNKRRSVMLIPALRDELGALRPSGADDDDLIVADTNGHLLHLGNWRNRVWNPAVEAVGLGANHGKGIARLTPYDGRHSFASALIHEGRSVLEVAAQLGHESASTTLRHYAHLVEEARDGERITLADAVRDVRDVRDSFAIPGRRHLRLVS